MHLFSVTATVLGFLAEHWAGLVLLALVALTAFYFAPHRMFEAMIAAAIVGAGVAVGHWWV